jgi:hypothetical protein
MRVFALFLIAMPLAGKTQTHYVNVYNSARSSIVVFEAAPAGTGAFRPIALADQPVHGGGDSAMIAFRKQDGGCLRDLRATFADGRVLLVKDYDVCNGSIFRTGSALSQARREAAQTRAREAPAR